MIPSDVVAERLREARKRRGWTAQQLAERCAAVGAPELTAMAISNIETGRRKEGRRTRIVTIDEALVLGYVLDAPFPGLFLPDDGEELPITAGIQMHPGDVLAWLSGDAEPKPEGREPWMRSVGPVVVYKELRRWMMKTLPADAPDSVKEAHLKNLGKVLDAAAEAGLRLWPLPRDWVEFLRAHDLVRYPDALQAIEDGESADG